MNPPMNTNSSSILTLLTRAVLLLLCVAAPVRAVAAERPNILWITIEDWSPLMSCYGTKGIHTPHVDKLAAEGIRYERAFTTSSGSVTPRCFIFFAIRSPAFARSAARSDPTGSRTCR